MRLISAMLALATIVLLPLSASADERFFTYVYEADPMPEGGWEFEQWITQQNGRKDQDYSAWDFRTEIEHGITSNLTGAVYLNWNSTRIDRSNGESENDTDFKGVSGELFYSLLSPVIDPVGLAVYGEVTTDGTDYEAETKIILSKDLGSFVLAAHAEYEMEWERENQRTEEEAYLEFAFGAAYKLSPQWSMGIEARNKAAYPDGLDLNGQEYQTWSVGPNVHYATPKWWTTLTVLPQVWGNGDGSQGGRNLVHEEEVEIRLIVGIHL